MRLHYNYNGIINLKTLNDLNEFNFQSLLAISNDWKEISGNRKWIDQIDIEFLFHEKYTKKAIEDSHKRNILNYIHLGNTNEVKAIVIKARMENFHMDFIKFNKHVLSFMTFLNERYNNKIENAIFTVYTEIDHDTVYYNPMDFEDLGD